MSETACDRAQRMGRLRRLRKERDSARSVAARLMSESARLEDVIRLEALPFLQSLDCECEGDEDEALVFEREFTPCARCVAIGKLEVALMSPAGIDRVLDVAMGRELLPDEAEVEVAAG